jgi:hypothetical protein
MSQLAKRFLALFRAHQDFSLAARNLPFLPIDSSEARKWKKQIDDSLEKIHRDGTLLLDTIKREGLPVLKAATDLAEWKYDVEHDISTLAEKCCEARTVAIEGQIAWEGQKKTPVEPNDPKHWSKVQAEIFDRTSDIDKRSKRILDLAAAIDEAALPGRTANAGDLAAYYTELGALEDECYAAAVAAGRSVIGLSCWNVGRNLTKLREIDARHGVQRDDPRVYSIAAYLKDRDAIQKEREKLQLQAETRADDESMRALLRSDARLTDCFARHFPGLSHDDVDTVDTPPKLWAYIDRYLIALGRSVAFLTRNKPPLKSYADALREVYGIMLELRIDGAPPRPYPDLSEQEAVHELRAIANNLEKSPIEPTDPPTRAMAEPNADATPPPHVEPQTEQIAPLAAAKAFLTALEKWRDLCKEWDGMTPRKLAACKETNFGADDRLNAFEEKCRAASEQARLIISELTLHGPAVMRFVNDDAGDSRLVHAWIKSQRNRGDDDWTKEKWEEVRLMVEHAIILAKPEQADEPAEENSAEPEPTPTEGNDAEDGCVLPASVETPNASTEPNVEAKAEGDGILTKIDAARVNAVTVALTALVDALAEWDNADKRAPRIQGEVDRYRQEAERNQKALLPLVTADLIDIAQELDEPDPESWGSAFYQEVKKATTGSAPSGTISLLQRRHNRLVEWASFGAGAPVGDDFLPLDLSDVPDLGSADTVTELWDWCNRHREGLRQLNIRLGEPAPARVAAGDFRVIPEIVYQCRKYLLGFGAKVEECTAPLALDQ